MSPEKVAGHFGSDPMNGLRARQVKKNRRLVHAMEETPEFLRVLKILLRQFTNPIEYLLIISAAVAWSIDHRRDSYFIVGVLIFNAIVGFFQEYRTERIIQALKDIVPKAVKVVRSGEVIEIPTASIVPGDVVLMSSGDRIPADVRISYCEGIELDESQLTGESEPVTKTAELINLPGNASVIQKNMAFYGSLISQGHGRGIVVATGRDVRFSNTLTRAMHKKDAPSPLELEVKKLALAVIIFAAGASLVTFIFALIRNLSVQEALIYVINLFVAVIPEGLPIVVTIVLTVAAYRMTKSKVVIRKLASADILGNIDLVLTDKTGTVTKGEMTTRYVWQSDNLYKIIIGKNSVKLFNTRGQRAGESQIEEIALAGGLANNARITYHLKSSRKHGDAIDISFLDFTQKIDCCRKKIAEWEKIAEVPFSSHRRFMAVLGSFGKDKEIYVKGAPENIISRSHNVIVDGKKLKLNQAIRDKFNGAYKSLARKGMKVIALAKKEVSRQKSELSEKDVSGLILLGIVGIEDAPRPDIAETIKSLERAGIEVKLVTGDHSSTAYSIAKEVGITSGKSRVIVGGKLNGLLAAHRDDVLRPAKVFARMSPDNKLDLVRYYQKKGLQVAMSGDGVNDAAAIKVANVGIAFAGEGGDVAQQTADVVLLDNNFNILVQGLHEGRTVWQNLRKIVFFLFSTNIAELLVIAGSLVFALPMPFTAIQILWINLVTDTLSDEALAFEPPEGRLYKNSSRSLVNKLVVRRIIVAALWQSFLILAIYIWAIGKFNAQEASSIAFFTLVTMQIYNLFNARSLHKSIFSLGPRKNYWMLAAVVITSALLFASLFFMPLANFLGLVAIDARVIISILLVSLSIIGVIELDKIICGIRKRKSGKSSF